MNSEAAEDANVTAFQARVYAAVTEVPLGRVTTYALLAAKIGCHSSQAIGQALKRNPFAPAVPCHRVIRSNLTIGGFAGADSGAPVERKRALLELEGVAFDQTGTLLDHARLYQP